MSPHANVVGPFPPGADPEDYDRLRRRVMWMLPAGIYLLGSRHGDRRNFMTCNWVTQVASEPKLVAVGVETVAHTHELVRKGRAMTISLLPREERAIARKFVKPAVDDAGARTLNGVSYRDAPVSGAPIPELALAYLDLRLERELDLGSHSLFIGEVVDAGLSEDHVEGEVLRMEDTRMNYGG